MVTYCLSVSQNFLKSVDRGMQVLTAPLGKLIVLFPMLVQSVTFIPTNLLER